MYRWNRQQAAFKRKFHLIVTASHTLVASLSHSSSSLNDIYDSSGPVEWGVQVKPPKL